VLQAEGYRLLEVRRGEDALALLEQHQGAINLLLTDVVMPGMSGRELAERLKRLRPQAKVLFMSGYADDAVVRHGVSMAEVEFLAKPFSLDQLVARVRQVLDK
jgi:DNA-binding response OmpR family regulator